MAELIKTFEVAGNVAERAYNIGKFVMDRLQVGAWAETANKIKAAVKPEAEDNIVRGSE